MIRLGPAGIPLSAKERSTLGGIRRVAELGLNALEVEFVRGVKMSIETAKELGAVARERNIQLSIHAPYYINLTSVEKQKIAASHRMILDSIERGAAMGARIVVIHAGYYGKLTSEECTSAMTSEFEKLRKIIVQKGWDSVLLGLETTGRLSQWGTVDEILKLCKSVEGTAPCMDFAHLFARAGGRIDYAAVLDSVKRFKHLHSHFSGIKYSLVRIGAGNERNHLPIGSPPFEPLAKEILKRNLDITIISESPVLEQDSLVMKKIFEKLGHKF